jgi:hypothetical protein
MGSSKQGEDWAIGLAYGEGKVPRKGIRGQRVLKVE